MVSTLEKQLIEKNAIIDFLLKEKSKNFETSDSTTWKDHLEFNNTNSKTEQVSNIGIGK